MNWHALFSAAIFLGKAALVTGFVAFLIYCQVSQTKERIATYKKTGRLRDFFKILFRY